MRFRVEKDREHSPSPGAATRRLEAFSDGVFAIAITLLALNLHVPELESPSRHALATALGSQWPAYLSFVLSFITLLIAWIYHHRLLDGAKRSNTRLLFINGMLLLIVSSVPFPTALLGEYLRTPAASVVCAVYAGYIGMLNLSYDLLWWEVERQQRGYGGLLNFIYTMLRGKLTRKSTAPPLGWRPPTSMLLSYLGLPCYLIAVGVAFWNPVVTLVICGALWIVWTVRAPMLVPEA